MFDILSKKREFETLNRKKNKIFPCPGGLKGFLKKLEGKSQILRNPSSHFQAKIDKQKKKTVAAYRGAAYLLIERFDNLRKFDLKICAN